MANEGLDLIKGNKVEDVYTVPLKPWARTGGSAVHIQLDGTGEINGAYVCEVAPQKHLEPQRYIYEEIIHILAGRGSTSVWYEGRRKHTFKWQTGSLFAIPLNAWRQRFNLSGSEPARYLAVTTAPIIMNLYRNDDFIFNNSTVFPDRYDSEEDYFSDRIRMETFHGFDVPTGVVVSNFIPDVNTIALWDSNRGERPLMRGVPVCLGRHGRGEPSSGQFGFAAGSQPGAGLTWRGRPRARLWIARKNTWRRRTGRSCSSDRS